MTSLNKTNYYFNLICEDEGDILKFLTTFNETNTGDSESFKQNWGHYVTGLSNIHDLRKLLKDIYENQTFSSSGLGFAYVLIWYDEASSKCGYDYQSDVSSKNYETTTNNKSRCYYENMIKNHCGLDDQLAKFMLTQDIPYVECVDSDDGDDTDDSDDVPLKRVGACGLPRVPPD